MTRLRAGVLVLLWVSGCTCDPCDGACVPPDDAGHLPRDAGPASDGGYDGGAFPDAGLLPDGGLARCAAGTCGSGVACGSDGQCRCDAGSYACGGACCGYSVSASGSVTPWAQLDVAASRSTRWSYVTYSIAPFAQNASLNVVTLNLVEGDSEAGTVAASQLSNQYDDVQNPCNCYWAAVALDSTSSAHVIRFANDTGRFEYLSADGFGGFVGEQVPCVGTPAAGVDKLVDLAIDPATQIAHAAWLAEDTQTSQSLVAYAMRDVDAGWSCDTFDRSGPVMNALALTLDGEGAPIVTYAQGPIGIDETHQVRIGRRAASGWTVSTLFGTDAGSPDAVGNAVAVGLTSSGKPWASFSFGNPAVAGVEAAFSAPAARSSVMRFSQGAGPSAAALAAGIDSEGALHAPLIGGAPGALELYDAVQVGALWHPNLVGATSLAASTVDPTGHVHFVYVSGSGAVLHAVR